MAKKASDESKASKVKKAPAASAKNAPVKAGKVAKAPATAAFAAAAPAKPKTARSAKAVSGKTTLPSVSARQRGHYIGLSRRSAVARCGCRACCWPRAVRVTCHGSCRRLRCSPASRLRCPRASKMAVLATLALRRRNL